MGSVSRTLALAGRAMKTGTSLTHSGETITPVDALFALGKVSDPTGALLVHAKLGGESLDALCGVILEIATMIFEYRQWPVFDRKDVPRSVTMERFAKQVLREFMGEPCAQCRGHGVLGHQADTRRERRTHCAPCKGAGFIRDTVRRICPTCRGKRYLVLTEELQAGKLKACTACAGSGVVLDSSRARANALGFDHAYILRVWAVRFNAVLAELRRIERRAVCECAAFLFGSDEGK